MFFKDFPDAYVTPVKRVKEEETSNYSNFTHVSDNGCQFVDDNAYAYHKRTLATTSRRLEFFPADSSLCNRETYHSFAPACKSSDSELSYAHSFLSIENELSTAVIKLRFGDPVSHIYNPLEYAAEPHANFTRKYCKWRKQVLFLGMNPGPYGMVQTGVPFGDAATVKRWLNIEGSVLQPQHVHPKRPVHGLDCRRSEVSGSRFWGYFEKLGSPENFFDHCFIYNVCPLAFMTASGKNVTPAQLKAADRRALGAVCDRALAKVVRLLEPDLVIAIGNYACERARQALGSGVRVEKILHPSPCSPLANRNWHGIVTEQFERLGVAKYFTAVSSTQLCKEEVKDEVVHLRGCQS